MTVDFEEKLKLNELPCRLEDKLEDLRKKKPGDLSYQLGVADAGLACVAEITSIRKDLKNEKNKNHKLLTELEELLWSLRVRKCIDRLIIAFDEPSFCEHCLNFGHSATGCTNPKVKKSRDNDENKI